MRYTAKFHQTFAQANAFRKKGNSRAAIKLLRSVVAEFPERRAAYLVIADILWDAGKLAASSREFRVATKLFPELKIASLGLFLTLWKQGRGVAALNELKRFQKVSPCAEYEEIIADLLKEL